MKRTLIATCMVAQLLVLAFMAAEREWIVRTGERLLLRTMPIDPQDPMRGAYVHLNYEISRVPKELCEGEIRTWMEESAQQQHQPRGQVVYASLQIDDNGLAELRALSTERPASGPFLRGRVEYVSEQAVVVRYGVEALFLEQYEAELLERTLLEDNVPLNAEVAVSPRGVAVLTGHRREALGLTVEFHRDEPPGTASEPGRGGPLVGATLRLTNHSDQPVAVVHRANDGSWRLVTDRSPTPEGYHWLAAETPVSPAISDDVRMLAPNETHEHRIDLTAPHWQVAAPDGSPVSLTTLQDVWNVWFRFEYRPPTPAEAANLGLGERVHGKRLRSRAFTPAGVLD